MLSSLKNNFPITPEASEKLKIYIDTLKEWNGRFNLTSFDDDKLWEEVVESSVIFADTIAYLHPVRSSFNLCDIGSGAGIPGMIIKIVMPDIRVDLIEATGKKAVFLSEIKKKLGLEGLGIVNKDAREFALRDKKLYNVVTGRAFGKKFMKYAFSLVSPEGYVLYYSKKIKKGEFEREPDCVRDYDRASVLIWKNG
ncbi:MAG: 16S rRNA (guanine(527)-N(7))-methyltransferase RsmG [Elusimicrobiota bacterium]|nr:16S rRNA (guanine(527)-N(7))-methyltransferase RsmG [Elusimicrobiota bacterium]